jgi:hypothetical protein
LLGYPDQALPLGNRALAILDRIKHGYTHSRGFYWNSVFHAFRREWPIVEQRAASAIESARQRGVAMVVAVGGIMQASARAMLEPRDETTAEIRVAMTAYGATGARFQSTYHRTLLAQALSVCGRHGEGLDVLRRRQRWSKRPANGTSRPRSIASKATCCWRRAPTNRLKPKPAT